MISSLQPTRPKYPASTSSRNPAPFMMPPLPPSPLNQQPNRALSSDSNPAIPFTSIHMTHCIPQASRPRTQIEALPPRTLQPFHFDDFLRPDSQVPFTPPPSSVQQYDPATRHPVFFTKTLQKPPFGVGSGSSVSPVAMGYVENSISNKRDGGNVKL